MSLFCKLKLLIHEDYSLGKTLISTTSIMEKRPSNMQQRRDSSMTDRHVVRQASTDELVVPWSLPRPRTPALRGFSWRELQLLPSLPKAVQHAFCLKTQPRGKDKLATTPRAPQQATRLLGSSYKCPLVAETVSCPRLRTVA